MAYPVVPSRRMPIDIDGTEIGYRITSFYADGPATWLTQAQKGQINSEGLPTIYQTNSNWTTYSIIWMFFPEMREIEQMVLVSQNGPNSTTSVIEVQGSNDSTNGADGTWETAIQPNGSVGINSTVTSWRTGIRAISFSGPKKVLRIKITSTDMEHTLRTVHVYGRKAAGETPDDITFCETNGAEITALNDFGDRPEGTTAYDSFKLKNASTSKMANAVNLQLNHGDFGLSFSESGPWTPTLDITSIAANSYSATVFIKNELGPPLLTLGPKTARVIATVGSWT